MATSGGDLSWHFSQVKGALDDEVAEGKKARGRQKYCWPVRPAGVPETVQFLQKIITKEGGPNILKI
mgnify:CR=1 FL=1